MLMVKTGGKRDKHALFRLDHSIESSEIELPSLVIVIEVDDPEKSRCAIACSKPSGLALSAWGGM
jgi:hypothetical protein